MDKLKEILKDTNLLIEDIIDGSTNTIEDFFKSVAEGFEKFFLN